MKAPNYPNLSFMRSKTLLAVSIAICSLASCKKNSGPNSSANSNKLKMYIEDARATPFNTIDTFYLTYDNNDRLTSLASAKLKFAYAYNSNTSFTLDLFENGLLSIHEIAFINGGTSIDSTFQFNNTHDSTTEKYLYSGSLLISKITYTYHKLGSQVDNREVYTYDNNGNLTKTVQTGGAGTITTYTYTDKPLQFTINPSYYPVQSKNLPATQKQTDGAGNTIATITYSYEFDSAGRVIKETDSVGNGVFVVKLYTYY
jgi:hypothetical protein